MACTTETELCQTIGDTKKFNLTFKDSDEVAIDITGSTVYLTVKTNKNDTDANALFQKEVTSHTSPTTGQTQVTVVPSDTKNLEEGSYWYDIQLTTSGGEVYTVTKGQYKLTYEVTDA